VIGMRLAVSNIAWSDADKMNVYGELKKLGVAGVEIAPTKFSDWTVLDAKKVKTERDLLCDFGLAVSSYQAIYFGRPELQLLQEERSFQDLLKHTVMVAEIAAMMSDGGIGVFGAPRNRIKGSLSVEDATKLGAERLLMIAEAIHGLRFILALESAPAHYGGDFLMTAQECADMVFRIAHPAIRLHLDTGCLLLAGEDAGLLPTKFKSILVHAHASEPDLVTFDAPMASHTEFAGSLRRSEYSRWLAIEMRQAAFPIAALGRAVDYVKAIYFE